MAELGLLGLLLGIVVYGARPWRSYTGDDIAVYQRYLAGDLAPWSTLMTEANVDRRFRPLTDAALRLGFDVAGADLATFRLLNLIGLVIAGTVVGLLTLFLTGRVLFGAAATALVVGARFVDFNVSTAYGVMENLSLLLFTATLWFCLDALMRQRTRSLVAANCCFLLLMLAHERFTGVILVVVATAALAPALTARRRAIWVAVPVVLTTVLLLYREVSLDSPLFVRLQGARPLSLAPLEVLDRMRIQALNLLGVNVGPDFLTGEAFRNAPNSTRMMALCALAVSCAALLAGAHGVAQRWRGDRSSIRVVAVLVTAVVAPLAGPLASDVADPRFLTTAYVALLLLLAYGLAKLPTRTGAGIVLALLVSVLAVNTAVRAEIVQRSYWNYSNTYADAARSVLSGYHPTEVSEVWYITNGSTLPENWYFAGDTFFQTYGAPAAHTTYVATAAEVPTEAWDSPGVLVLGEGGVIVTDFKARRPNAP